MPPSASPFFRPNKPPARQSIRIGSRKPSVRRNTSILQFFNKAETPPKPVSSQNRITQYISQRRSSTSRPLSLNDSVNTEVEEFESLFVEDVRARDNNGATTDTQAFSDRERSASPDGFWAGTGAADNAILYGAGEDRYHENGKAVKKRKVGYDGFELDPGEVNGTIDQDTTVPQGDATSKDSAGATPAGKLRFTGPFLIDSDSESEPGFLGQSSRQSEIENQPDLEVGYRFSAGNESMKVSEPRQSEEVSEDSDEDSRGMGSECSGTEEPSEFTELAEANAFGPIEECPDDEEVAVCPICQTSLRGLTDSEASLHVNQCLDGDSAPLPRTMKSEVTKKVSKASLSRAELKVTSRPGQRSPFTVNSTVTTSSSAFSKIMSGNAEDAAWAAAAANEVASRGKQAYERTCPFYKILPGFSICVDAFRYGAVEGCNAYFLSHFHSDHYIGLNSNWSHGPIYCSKVTGNLVRQQLKVNPKFIVDLEFEKPFEVPETGGVRVTMIPANHCPGSSLFLFEKVFGQGKARRYQRVLHCGDFRASPAHIQHPLIRPDAVDPVTGQPKQQRIDVCYLDTTYLNPKYAFPSQEDVVNACARMCMSLNENKPGHHDIWKRGKANGEDLDEKDNSGNNAKAGGNPKPRLLVVIGTYSIGKERICLGIAKALNCKIFATAAKQRICACLEDPELSSLLTSDPLEAQVHMHSLMEIRVDTLSEYLSSFKPHFTHIVGFRPTGWNYRPPAGRMIDNPLVSTVLRSESWKARFTVNDLVPQRGSNKQSSCFGVPYSEHSSFRELTMFCCALRLGKVIPTVNVGSRKTREKMKLWVDKWEAEKRKSGFFKLEEGATRW
ncbi:DNA repair metallo-beta-lactamase family protein [Coccidioides posadasii C735 delta SOWgp]|uniref:DNA repair metallo-beta-lactamase family protein n=1 Tax=Coccidioides posadasii (strain C735) TaxID=222929 RepID=C5PGJ9_COCP7|nr:DNA repair metallo-beta-lactamase family protein [Coccidioides posadasii C735 delta SOWgp]EER23652.1 DNA repair metallo-beta-lactamase family protein [Coccidioides posadasii C735 delta SOWgp]|eukprot:XP_003065797.1 DNA repair metallo-beta-lactamase family protein [Coccidioides posadasii C735 delta SOWgp]